MNKGGKHDYADIMSNEDEFRCYLRPIIEEENQGWGFIAQNVDSNNKNIYPKIYRLRKWMEDDKLKRE